MSPAVMEEKVTDCESVPTSSISLHRWMFFPSLLTVEKYTLLHVLSFFQPSCIFTQHFTFSFDTRMQLYAYTSYNASNAELLLEIRCFYSVVLLVFTPLILHTKISLLIMSSATKPKLKD